MLLHQSILEEKLNVLRGDAQNYYAALRIRIRTKGLKDKINLVIRNAKRKKVKAGSGKTYLKLEEGDVYFSKE